MVESGRILCSHDVCAMAETCRLWNSLCRPFFLVCPVSPDPLACAVTNGWYGRVSSLLPESPGVRTVYRPRLSLLSLCRGVPFRPDDHVRCVQLLLAREAVPRIGKHDERPQHGDLPVHCGCLRALALYEKWGFYSLAHDVHCGFGRIPEVEILLLEWANHAVQSGVEFKGTDFSMAASTGSMQFFKFVRDRTPYYNCDLCDYAVDGGNVEILQMISRIPGLSCSSEGALRAAARGHLEMLKHLVQVSAPVVSELLDAAARSGNVECLRFLNETVGCRFGDECVLNALTSRDPDCLRYCLENGASTPDWQLAWQCAIESGNAECLLALVDSGHSQEVTVSNLLSATKYGKLDILRVLCSLAGAAGRSCLFTVEVAREASASGQWECLRMLHDMGCPWDSTVCQVAAQKGHIACLRYAHEHGCPWTSTSLKCATRAKRSTCVRYINLHGLTCSHGEPGPDLQ